MSDSHQKPKKKNRRLLLEVSIVTFILFLLSMTVLSIFSVRNSYDFYYKTKTENMTRNVNMIRNVTDDPIIFLWLLDYLRSHEIDYDYLASYEREWRQDGNAALVKISLELPSPESTEEINRLLSPDEQKALAYWYQNQMFQIIGYQLTDNDYDEIYMIDVTGEHFGYSYFITENDDIAGYVRDNEMIRQAIHTGCDGVFGETVFEMSRGSEMILTGCLPIYENGAARAVILVQYNCSDYAAKQTGTILTMILIGVIALLITDTLLMLFIYRRVTRPLSAVKSAVVSYKTDKDSGKTSEELQKIKARNEVGVLADSFSGMTQELDSYMSENLRLTAERERIAAELELAAKIQLDMLPTGFPEHSKFELFASMTPAREVGGDFYDYFMADDDHLCLVIADVSGKGMPAALFMMKSKQIIKEIALSGGTPEQILAKANNALCEDNSRMMFVTVWLGILELSTGKLSAANAGHEYPVVRQPGEEFRLLKDQHGTALGLFPQNTYNGYELPMKKGSTLFVYTDGVDEAFNSERKMFKTDRLLSALNGSVSPDPRTLTADVRKAIDDFIGDVPPSDDITMLCIRMK